MRQTIDQFMWSFQQHFRIGIQHGVERALEAIGASTGLKVMLVGFASDDGQRHDICIEPETGPLLQQHFRDVLGRADEIFRADPESLIHHSVPSHHEARQKWLYRRSRALAVGEAIEQSGVLPEWRPFVSASARIGGYDVHTCIAVEAERFGALDSLDFEYLDRVYVGRSLQHEVVAECLRRADTALYLPDPGSSLQSLGAPAVDVVCSAARTFASGCLVRTGEPMAGDLFSDMNEITELSYERAMARGRLLIARPDHPGLEVTLRLRKPLVHSSARGIRKLLETSDESTWLLSDGSSVYGLGRVDCEEPCDGDVIEIVVSSHATWELRTKTYDLMRVAYGKPTLPKTSLNQAAFEDTINRVLGDADIGTLLGLVQAAANAHHGSTLVISANPESEVERLSGQATLVEPVVLNPDDVKRLGHIDGATVLDVHGTCYAIGAILDGVAMGDGDPARGSRFNSAVRYQSRVPGTVVVVVSDDGMVDLVPVFRPRVPRERIDYVLDSFRRVAFTDPVDVEEFARARKQIKEYAFYLNQVECDEVNSLYEKEQDRRLAAGGIAVREPDLTPDAQMNETYFC